MPADRSTIGQPRPQRTPEEANALLTAGRAKARAREKLDFCKAYVLHQGTEHPSADSAAAGGIMAWERLMQDPEIKELLG